eukprot:12593814-Alexandrium_andersonii.AAC.1
MQGDTLSHSISVRNDAASQMKMAPARHRMQHVLSTLACFAVCYPFFSGRDLSIAPGEKGEGVHDCTQLLSGRVTGSRSAQYLPSALLNALMWQKITLQDTSGETS